MHCFEVHSNESACRKSGRLGLEKFFRHMRQGTINMDDVNLFAGRRGDNLTR